MVEHLVLNESIWVKMGPEDENGNRPFEVYNGNWYGYYNPKSRMAWAERYPEDKHIVTSVRPAIKGECKPYY